MNNRIQSAVKWLWVWGRKCSQVEENVSVFLWLVFSCISINEGGLVELQVIIAYSEITVAASVIGTENVVVALGKYLN